jgi:hypothetical protein
MTTLVNFNIKNATGDPVANAQIDITLTEPGVEYLSGDLTIPTTTKGTTDSEGFFQAELGAVDTAPYIAVVYDPKSNRKGVYEFFVPENENPVDVADLVLLPKPSGISYDSASIAQITSDRVRAEQAANKSEAGRLARYTEVKIPSFTSIDGVNSYVLKLTDSNGFLRVSTLEGTIVIPDEGVPFEIGTGIVFVNNYEPPQNINITFASQTEGVVVRTLGSQEIKLSTRSDFIVLVKVAPNLWTIANLAAGSAGLEGLPDYEPRFINIEADISGLQGWREAFRNELDDVIDSTAENTNAIAAINNSIASLVNLIALLSTSIDERIAELIPTLPELDSYIAAASAYAGAAGTSAGVAGLAANSASNAAAYAQEWANKDENVLISEAAGGDLQDDYSAKHWAAKAEEIVPSLSGGGGKFVTVNEAETDFEFIKLAVQGFDVASAIGRIYSQLLGLQPARTSNIGLGYPEDEILFKRKNNPTPLVVSEVEKVKRFNFLQWTKKDASSEVGTRLIFSSREVELRFDIVGFTTYNNQALCHIDFEEPFQLSSVDASSLRLQEPPALVGGDNRQFFHLTPDGEKLFYIQSNVSGGSFLTCITLDTPFAFGSTTFSVCSIPVFDVLPGGGFGSLGLASLNWSGDGKTLVGLGSWQDNVKDSFAYIEVHFFETAYDTNSFESRSRIFIDKKRFNRVLTTHLNEDGSKIILASKEDMAIVDLFDLQTLRTSNSTNRLESNFVISYFSIDADNEFLNATKLRCMTLDPRGVQIFIIDEQDKIVSFSSSTLSLAF